MSGEHQPSYSAQQTGSENGDYYDDLLGVETFDARDFERDFGDFEFSDFPEEPTSKQDVVPTETPLSHGKPQENQPNAEVRSYVDANESAELQEVSSLQDIIPADRVSSCDQPQVVQSNGEHETHFDLNDFEDGEDSLDHQNSISPQNSFGNDQLEGGLNNSQPLFQFEFSAEDWKAYDDHMANEDFPEIPDTETQHGQRIERRLEKAKSSGDSKHHSRQQHHAYQHVGPVYHDPYSPGNIDDSSNLTESPMDSRQWSAVNTPAMDSGYGTAAMSRETTHALMSATPYQLGNTVGHSSSGNMQGASYDMYAAANSPTDDTHGAYDEDDEEEDVPSQPTFETFEERDPLIVQNPRKAKWGQTGTRNGLEVWFNPETSKWQPSASHHSMRRLQKLKRTGSSKHGGHAQKHASPVYHTPNPQDRFNPSSASPDLPTVENGEGPVISASGIDSGCGKYIPARDATFGPFSTTPDQVSNAVGIPSLGNIYNSRNPAYPSPYQETYNEDVADDVEEAEIEVEDKEPGFDPAADLNYYAEDPKTGVIESRRRKGWGRTGMRNGVEVWFNPKTEEWQPSASHHSYRDILLKRAQAEHPDKEYLHRDQTDGLPFGETAFFLPHQSLGPDRDDCPDECFAWPEDDPEDEPEDKEDGNKAPQKKKRKPNPRPRGPHPGFWFEDGKILLDPHNNPVKKHLDLPLTLSAETEGYKLQLMRLLNASILQKDEWARMPRWIRRQVPKTDQMIIRYIGSPNTHINMPSQRFRDEKGTVAGNKRDGTKKIREGLKALFAEHGFDPSLTGSTRGFGRDLLPWEQDLVKLGNTGKHPGRAGEARALDDETRNKNLQKTLRKIEKGRKQAQADAAKAGDAFGKRPRDEEEGLNEDSNSSPQKRVYQKPGMIPSNIGIGKNQTKSKLGGRSRKGRGKQGSSQTQRYGTYGAAPSPYQNANTLEEYQQASSLIDSQFIRNHEMLSYPGIGLETDARLDHLRQSREQTQTIRGPYIDGHFESQNAPYSMRVHRAQDTNGVPIRDLSGFGGESGGYVPSQTLGKRDRPHLGSESQEDSLGPGGKRRRMPGTERYILPPGTQRRAEKKLRMSKRDERLPPAVFNIDETGQNTQQASQVAAALETVEAVPTAYQSLQVADAEGPDPPQAPIPSPVQHIPRPDIRDVPPATEWECERLKKALECTRWAYEQWTGMDAPQTNRNESYNAQFGVIFLAFHEWWSSRGNPERLNPAEWLVQLDPWEGTVADWKPPVTDTLFYECMRRGFYAPRNADGLLQQPDYQHNYQDYPWYNPADVAGMR